MAEFEVTTTVQVERTYKVQAADEEQARKRMRVYITDKDLIGEGLVNNVDSTDSGGERIKDVRELERSPVALAE